LGGWFFLILAPTSSIIPINDYMFEHRMYLPLAAVIAAVVIAAFWLLDWFRLSPAQVPRLAGSLMLVLAIVLGAVAFQRNTTWATDYRLWTDNVTKRPTNGRGHANLRRATNRIHLEAAYAFLCGDTERAANICATAIAENPDQLGRFANLAALAADKLGHPEDAILLWWKALELDPRSLDARLELARRLGPTDREQALNCLRIALRQSPSFPQAHHELAKLLALTDPQLAKEHFRQALELTPREPLLLSDYADFLVSQQELPQAIEAYRQALALDSDLVELGPKLEAAQRKLKASQ
jgi:Tfp pilus assembly protein PilF